MPPLLPRERPPRLRLKPGVPSLAAMARYDAVLLLLPTDTRPSRSLPDQRRWQQLHARSRSSHADVRSVTLDNDRQTLGLIGYCRENAEPFEVLRVAGRLAQRALADRPQPRRIAIIAQASRTLRTGWQEALYAALSAHSFPLPTARKPRPPATPKLAWVDVYGESELRPARAECMAAANNLTRHLTALPPNILDAGAYRRVLAQLARRHGLRLRWYGEPALRRLGAGAFLAVSRGNARRDAGIAHLSYRPRRRRNQRPDIALVGKGILFDTGGTNLKPHRSMLDMHTDMAGSAVALATVTAAAQLRIPLAIDCWLAITENSIGPNAYRPQEVVQALNGTTIQVIHSDAEGRMALADTLALAARRNPRVMLDFATLTGACVYALTERMSGLFANQPGLAAQALAASSESGERLWQFPMPEDFDSDIESSTADIAQCALEGKGDHILATRFLKRFVPDEIAWAHVDLSSATRRGGLAHVPTEITGFGTRFALTLLLDHLGKK